MEILRAFEAIIWFPNFPNIWTTVLGYLNTKIPEKMAAVKKDVDAIIPITFNVKMIRGFFFIKLIALLGIDDICEAIFFVLLYHKNNFFLINFLLYWGYKMVKNIFKNCHILKYFFDCL